MNDEQKPAPGTKLCKWAVWIAAAGVVVTLIGILGAAALGPFRAMLSLTLGSLLLIIGAVLAVIGLVRSRGTAGNASFPLTVGALAVGAAAIINVVIMIGSGGGPPIHDISTDTASPPEFVAVVELRGPTDNPPEYSGDETARLQLEAYPDIETIVLLDPPSFVFETASGSRRGHGLGNRRKQCERGADRSYGDDTVGGFQGRRRHSNSRRWS